MARLSERSSSDVLLLVCAVNQVPNDHSFNRVSLLPSQIILQPFSKEGE